jgi:hypothetical protein
MRLKAKLLNCHTLIETRLFSNYALRIILTKSRLRYVPVDEEGDPLPEALAAGVAGERPLARVDPLVVLQRRELLQEEQIK